MIKNSVIALVTATALLGAAAPAMASSLTGVSDNDFNEDYVLAELQHQGINASSVEEWGSSYYIAFVTDETGAQKMLYLDPDSLKVVR